jgi:hypothetical protein
MNLSLFQRLTLIALSELIWICGGRAQYGPLALLLSTIAFGHHTPSQQESLFEDYKRLRGK